MIRIHRLNFTVGNFALRDVTLDIERGEYYVLLGKAGSGKTLLLECLAGLHRVTSGGIAIDGRPVEHIEPAQRGMAYVPQDYVLFTARTVRQNIEFGLRARRTPRHERLTRVTELAEMLGIRHLLERATHGLSGGERQRVALARALAIRPAVLLLDEPVSAVDEEARDSTLAELKRIQRKSQTTMLHVCHVTDEMRLVADRAAILDGGRIVQTGTPEQICRRPASAGTARLLRLGTVLTGLAANGRIDFGDFSISSDERCQGEVEVLIPVACIRLASPCSQGDGSHALVTSVLPRTGGVRLELDIGRTRLIAEIPSRRAEELRVEPGSQLRVIIPPKAIVVFPAGQDAGVRGP